MRERHFARIGDRPAGLRLEVVCTPIPELRQVERRIQDGWCVDRSPLPSVTDGCRQVVRAAHAQVVAGVAGNESGSRQTRVEEQLFSQFNQRRIGDVVGLDLLDRFVARRADRNESDEKYSSSGNQQSGGHDAPRGGNSRLGDNPPITRRLSPSTRHLVHDGPYSSTGAARLIEDFCKEEAVERDEAVRSVAQSMRPPNPSTWRRATRCEPQDLTNDSRLPRQECYVAAGGHCEPT